VEPGGAAAGIGAGSIPPPTNPDGVSLSGPAARRPGAATESLFLALLAPALAALDHPALAAPLDLLARPPAAAPAAGLNIPGAPADKSAEARDPRPAGPVPGFPSGPRIEPRLPSLAAPSGSPEGTKPAATTRVERVETAKLKGSEEVRVDLVSDELGAVSIRVRLRGGSVSATVAPASAAAAHALGAEVATVRAALALAGVAVGSWVVVAPNGRRPAAEPRDEEKGEKRAAPGLPAETVGGRRRRTRLDFVV